jgi:outer membrane protein TolC
MKRFALILACASFASLLTAKENEAAKRSLSLKEAIELAVANNLTLQIERYNPQIALYNVNQAYAGYEPAFNVRGEHSYNENVQRLLEGNFPIPGSETKANTLNMGIGGDGGGAARTPWGMTYSLGASVRDTSGTSFGRDTNNLVIGAPFESSVGSVGLDITQPLLRNMWIDSTRLRITVSKNRLKYSEYGLKLRLIDIITRTEQAYYTLVAARENIVTQEKALELANQLVQENRKRVQVGALAPLDEKQAEAQAAASRAALLASQNALAIAEDLFKNLITDNYPEWASVEILPSDALQAERQFFSRQDSWTRGLTERPDLVQAKLDVERAGVDLKYARNQLWPQLDVFGSFGYNGGGVEFSSTVNSLKEANTPFYSVGGQLSIPLGNRSARNAYRSVQADREQLILGVKQLEQQVMIEIDDGIKQAQTDFERVQATREAVDFADAALQAEQKKLESGKSTSFEVLRLQRDLTTTRRDATQALADYNKSLAQLNRFQASTLARHGINLEIK